MGLSFLGPSTYTWPLQNLVNLAFITKISSILQFPRLSTILVALLGLTLYDVVSVFGLFSAENVNAAGMSVMETVARSRISSPGDISSNLIRWQPGLLEVVLNGRVTDGLGLGDVIFPSMLSGWALRFDQRMKEKNLLEDGAAEEPSESGRPQSKAYAACLAGYAVGCGLCEVNQSGGGLPALLFIVPSMIAALTAYGVTSRRMGDFFSNEE